MVEIKKSVFDAYVENAWWLDLGVAQSSRPLQLSWHAREKI